MDFIKWLAENSGHELFANIPGYNNVRFVSRSDKVLVMVNVAKLDALWKKDFNGFYIPPGVSKTDARCVKVAQYLGTGGSLQAPEILVGGFRQTFHDGRHRFAVLRDAGAKQIPVAVRPEYVKQIEVGLGG